MPRVGTFADRKPYTDEEFRQFMGRVKLRCFQLEINQMDLSKKLGINHATVSGWWSLKYMPQGMAFFKLPKALECDGHWLLTGEGKPDQRTLTMDEGYYQGASIALTEMQNALEELTEAWAGRAKKRRR